MIVAAIFFWGFAAATLAPLWWPLIRFLVLPFFSGRARSASPGSLTWYLIGASMVAGCILLAVVTEPGSGLGFLLVVPITGAWVLLALGLFLDPLFRKKRAS